MGPTFGTFEEFGGVSNSDFAQELTIQFFLSNRSIAQFHKLKIELFPTIGSIIFKVYGFGVVQIIGIDSK